MMTDKELVQALRNTETRSKRGLLDEAADRLEELADELHRTTSNVGEWIPTEQRMPEDDTVCAVLVSGRPMANIKLYHSLQLAEYNHKDGWILEMWPEWETKTVTHWMLLPDADMEGLT